MKLVTRIALMGLVAAALVVSAQPTLAHHSSSGFGDKSMEVTGKIKEFQFKNPHSFIQVLVDNPNGGAPVEWSVEWTAPNALFRQGYGPSTFPPGAKVMMRFRYMLNGAPAGLFVGAKMEDGKIIGRWQ